MVFFFAFLLATDSIELIMIKRRHAFRKHKKKHRSETAIKFALATALLNLIAELVGLLAQMLSHGNKMYPCRSYEKRSMKK